MVQEQLQRSMSKSSRHTRELARRLGKLTEVQAVLGWGLILLIFALLGVIYLNQSTRTAAVGRRVMIMRGELSEVKRINADLERDVADAQDISRLVDEAQKMGFVSAQSSEIEYFVIPQLPPIAEYSEQESLPVNETTPIESISEGLWLVVESGIGSLMRGESSEQ
jgi:cell division protein FtsL